MIAKAVIRMFSGFCPTQNQDICKSKEIPFPDNKKRSPPSGRDLRFFLFSKEEIETYQNTEHDPIIAKHLKIMLFDVSKQKTDDKQR